MKTVLGYDAAYHYQGDLDYEALKAKGGKFIITKAGEGWRDYKAYHYVESARAGGMITGTYWYYRQMIPDANGNQMWCEPKRQAEEYWKATKGEFDLPPALDVEKTGNPHFNSDHIHICLKEIERLFGRKPIIYTGFYIWRDNVGSPAWSVDYDLWLAQYRDTANIEIPPPFTDWKIHQFSDKIEVGGTVIDHNNFNGDLMELLAYAGIGEIHPPEKQYRRVIVNWLSFRSRPAMYEGDRPAIGRGVKVEVLGKEKTDIDWLHVRLSGGDEGYISAHNKYTEGV